VHAHRDRRIAGHLVLGPDDRRRGLGRRERPAAESSEPFSVDRGHLERTEDRRELGVDERTHVDAGRLLLLR
jgi:hypothetical protein